MAALLVRPLPAVGVGRRPVCSSAPVRGCVACAGLLPPCPPPRVRGGGFLRSCRAGVAAVSTSSVATGSRKAPAGSSPWLPTAGAPVQSWAENCPSGRAARLRLTPPRPLAHIAGSHRLGSVTALSSLGAGRGKSQLQPTAAARASTRGRRSPLFPRCRSTFKPHHGSRAM